MHSRILSPTALVLLLTLTTIEGEACTKREVAISLLEKAGVRVYYRMQIPSEKKGQVLAIEIRASKWKGDKTTLGAIATLRSTDPSLRHLYILGGTDILNESIKEIRSTCPGLLVSTHPEVFLGVGIDDLTEHVIVVLPGSSAARAGILRHDKIVSIDSCKVTDTKSIVDALWPMAPERRVAIVLQRGSQRISVEARLQSLAEDTVGKWVEMQEAGP